MPPSDSNDTLQHFVSRIKKKQRWDVHGTGNVSLWPWPLTFEVIAIVGYTRLSTLSKYQVQRLVILRLFVFDLWAMGKHGSDWSRDLVTSTFDLGGHDACGWCGSSSSIRIPSLKFVSYAMPFGIYDTWRVSALMGLVTLTFDRLTLKLVCELHLSRVTVLPNLGTLDLWVLKLFATYATDGQTDGRTSNAYCPLPHGVGSARRGRNN